MPSVTLPLSTVAWKAIRPPLLMAGCPNVVNTPPANACPVVTMGVSPPFPAVVKMAVCGSGPPEIVATKATTSASLSASARWGRSIAVESAPESVGVARSSTPVPTTCPASAMVTSAGSPGGGDWRKRKAPAGVGCPAAEVWPLPVSSAMKATSPLALTAGRPMNDLNFPCAGAVAPSAATWTRVVGAVMRATMMASLAAAPWRLVRKATQPSPAAAGHPAKLGPAKTPPPGAGWPRAATAILEAALAGSGAGADSTSRTKRLAVRFMPERSPCGQQGGCHRFPERPRRPSRARGKRSCTSRAASHDLRREGQRVCKLGPARGGLVVFDPERRKEDASGRAAPLDHRHLSRRDDRQAHAPEAGNLGVEGEPCEWRGGGGGATPGAAEPVPHDRERRAVHAGVAVDAAEPAAGGEHEIQLPLDQGGTPQPELEIEKRGRVRKAQERARVADVESVATRRDGERAARPGTRRGGPVARKEREAAAGQEEEQAAALGAYARGPGEVAGDELERTGKVARGSGRGWERRRPRRAGERGRRRGERRHERRAPASRPAQRNAELELQRLGVSGECGERADRGTRA